MAPQFSMNCDGNIAQYIQGHAKVFNRLKSKVGQIARCKSLVPDQSGKWKITVEKKLEHDGDWQKQAICIIKEVFEEYSHREISITDQILRCKTSLEADYESCTLVWDSSENLVKVTGPTDDVEDFHETIEQRKLLTMMESMTPQFSMNCDGNIAQYIQGHAKVFNRLKSKVGQIARCKSLVPDQSGKWKITVEKKLEHDGDWQQQAICIIKEVFEEYSHREISITDQILRCKTSLEADYESCTLVWDSSENLVKVTGPTDDVEDFHETIEQRKLLTMMEQDWLAPAQFQLKCDGKIAQYLLGKTQYFNDLKSNAGQVARCQSIVINKANQGIITVERKQTAGEYWKEEVTSIINNFLEKFSFVQKPADDFIKAQLPWLEENHPDCIIKWNSMHKFIEVTGPAADVEKVCSVIQQSSHYNVSKTTHGTEKCQFESKAGERFCIFHNAEDKNVLQFVKNHVLLCEQLKQFCQPFGQLEIDDENCKVIVFRTEMFDDELRNACYGTIQTFLQQFSSMSSVFPIQKLRQLYSREPQLFQLSPESESRAVCRFNQKGVLRVCGYKSDVVKRMEAVHLQIQDSESSGKVYQESHCFVYQQSTSEFREILKFILASPVETFKLKQRVSGLARYEAFPSIQSPLGLTLYATSQPESSFLSVATSMMDSFFALYDCKTVAHDAESLSYAKRFPLSNDGIFLDWSNTSVKIVGLAEKVNSAVAVINGAVDVAKQKKEPGNADTRSSQSSNNAVVKFVPYYPKKKYVDDFLLVMKHKTLKNKLNESCQGVCTVTGTKIPLHLRPVGEEESRPAFIKKSVNLMEKFLNRLVEERVAVDTSFAESKPQWLSNLQKTNRTCMSLKLQDGVIVAKGLIEDVKECIAVIKKNMVKTSPLKTSPLKTSPLKTSHSKASHSKKKPCSRDVCRILTNCDVIDQLNRKFAGKVEVNCSLEEETVEFKGDDLYIQAAEDEILSMNLIERTPELTELKLELLKQVLAKKRSKSEEMIYEEFSEHQIKGAVVMRNDQVILVAADGKDFTQGCRLLENIIHMNLVSIPSTSTSELQRQTLKDLVRDISEYKDMIVTEKDNIIWVVGLIEEDVDRTTALLKNFFKHSKSVTLSYPCDAEIAQHVSKFSASDDQFPSSVTVNIVGFGVQLVGPQLEAEKALHYLDNKSFQTKLLNQSEISLASHVASDAWKTFLGLLESKVRCSVTAQQVSRHAVKQAASAEQKQRSPSVKPKNSSSCEVKIAGVTVKLCQGDIAKEDTDVIVNGCSSDFNLSNGPLSKNILAKAGKELQTECRSSPLIQTPVIRVTRGMKLKCKYIAHLVTPRSIDEYAKRIKTALDYAEVLGSNSIALPTLGAGKMGLGDDAVATKMLKACRSFANEQPLCVKEIRIVVFDERLTDVIRAHLVRNQCASDLPDVDEELFTAKLEMLKEQCKSSSMKDTLQLSLLYERDNTFLLAKHMIDEHLATLTSSKVISNAVISKLGPNDLIDLYQAALSSDASLEIDQQSSKIVIASLAPNVAKMNDYVKDIFYDIQEAETLSKQTIWRWTRSSGDFIDLPLRVSAAIEKEFQLSPRSFCSFRIYGETLQVSLADLTSSFNKTERKLKRFLIGMETGIPPEWSSMNGESWKRVPLNPFSPEYNSVLKQFKKSNPGFQLILKVERIQNPALYQQYAIKKKDVERHMTSNEPVERGLFHGTSEVDAKKICAHGFDRGFAGKNATVYGKGSYFAVNSSYSANYAEREAGLAYMFLARVLTGDYCIGKSSYKAPPVKDSSDNRLYDSVVDDIYNPNIFVVFKDSSVYPSYLITLQ